MVVVELLIAFVSRRVYASSSLDPTNTNIYMYIGSKEEDAYTSLLTYAINNSTTTTEQRQIDGLIYAET